MNKKVILSGMRPTGKLHLGHYVGALTNWVKLQDEYKCFFMVADWHAIMSEYKNPAKLPEYAFDNLCDWLAYGIDPKKSTIFTQSEVNEHLDMFMILSFITPLGWLSRCPTFKEQVTQLKEKEINTYAFLGYPTLQAADIVLYKASAVPVGEDQLPHLELCREIVRRFNFLYSSNVLVEPKDILTESPRLPGLDGRKMSKSYNNCIFLDDDDGSIDRKVLTMITDPARVTKNDKGHPDVCSVFSYYNVFDKEQKEEVRDWCVNAKRGCKDCKANLAKIIKNFIEPKRTKKQELLNKKDYVYDILHQGKLEAQKVAGQTLREVKDAMGLTK